MLLVLFGKTGDTKRDHVGVRLRRQRLETIGGGDADDVPLWTLPLDTVADVKLENPTPSHQSQKLQQLPRPVMIVVPCTLIDNWTNELNKWGIFSVAYLGKTNEVEGTLDAARRGTVEIVLMSYEQMVSKTKSYNNLQLINCTSNQPSP